MQTETESNTANMQSIPTFEPLSAEEKMLIIGKLDTYNSVLFTVIAHNFNSDVKVSILNCEWTLLLSDEGKRFIAQAPSFRKVVYEKCDRFEKDIRDMKFEFQGHATSFYAKSAALKRFIELIDPELKESSENESEYYPILIDCKYPNLINY